MERKRLTEQPYIKQKSLFTSLVSTAYMLKDIFLLFFYYCRVVSDSTIPGSDIYKTALIRGGHSQRLGKFSAIMTGGDMAWRG